MNDPTPIARRRQLTPAEIEAAAQALARGEALHHVARWHGMVAAALRRQVQQMVWDAWCDARGLTRCQMPE